MTNMVLISGGNFLMGSEDGNSNEYPIHEVFVDPFFLDKSVVTNAEYRKFLISNPQWQKHNVTPDKVDGDYLNLWNGLDFPAELQDYAVINVSWYAATAYAEWIGKRLPTEAEWEFAAGGKNHTKWSHGDIFIAELYWYNIKTDPIGYPTKQLTPNNFQLYDMCGGIWEWTRDYYTVEYYHEAPKHNPINTKYSEYRALRGGSQHFDTSYYLRCAVRGSNTPVSCHEDYGFRCAKDGAA